MLEGQEDTSGAPKVVQLRRDRYRLEHRLEMMGVRKSMCTSEIREIDDKIANLNTMRRVILERLANLEEEERDLEQELGDVSESLEAAQDDGDDEPDVLASSSPTRDTTMPQADDEPEGDQALGFMSESIYSKLPSFKDSKPKPKRKRMSRRISMPVLHEHMEPGSQIRELQAHNDTVTALDFDAPFGIMVTAALDDTVRVWDLSAGRCMGLLSGHLSSVRCLQVEDNLVATGSMDASIRLWDLAQADYNPSVNVGSNIRAKQSEPEDAEADGSTSPAGDDPVTPTSDTEQGLLQAEYHTDAMADCHMFTLSSHVAEVTALNFHGSTLVSGSADKTLRQWDLEKGRCVQTLDVLWAAAQASTINPSVNSGPVGTAPSTDSGGGWWRPTGGRLQSAEADFVGAVQVFDAALACGTADGMVRLWDLRSGMVHRSLVGHTGPVTALQFDDVFLVTGSQDRSIRVCDSSYFPFHQLRFLVLTVVLDMGSSHRWTARRICLRKPYHIYAIRYPPHCRRCGRECCQNLR